MPQLTRRLCVQACVDCCVRGCCFFSTHLRGLDPTHRLDLSFTTPCLCLPGLVHGPEPNPQQTREEEAFGGSHPDGHQPDGARPARSACQEQQQVDICLFFMIPPPDDKRSSRFLVISLFKEHLCRRRGGRSDEELYQFPGSRQTFCPIRWERIRPYESRVNWYIVDGKPKGNVETLLVDTMRATLHGY